MNNVKILYLAHYAPQSIGDPIPTGIHDMVYAEYHHKVFELLKHECNNLVSSRDPGILLQSGLDFEYIFSLYNRMPFRNSEIFVSSLAEYHGIPYLGARPNIRALAEDKHLGKMLATYAGVPTAKWTVVNVGESISELRFQGPYFVKPRFGAASKHIDEASICDTFQEVAERTQYLHSLDLDAIIEEQVDGIYFTSPVLQNFGEPVYLPCIEEISVLKGNVATYEQKRKITDGLYRTINRDKTIESQLQTYSKRMFSLVQPLDYTRFDFIVDRHTGIPSFLEFNVCCNLGEHSTVSQAAKHAGIDYKSLLNNILYSSLYRSQLIHEFGGYKF